jgi:hypothetical protein
LENIWTKREELVGGWRCLHNEKLCNLYASPNIVKVITSRRMRWVSHIYAWERQEMSTKFSSENLKGKDSSEKLGLNGEENIGMSSCHGT